MENILQMLRALPSDDRQRTPYPSEREYFAANPKVAGMATEDGRVITNPYSDLSDGERNAVIQNELARLFMRENPQMSPDFYLTQQQTDMLGGGTYANAPPHDRMATIAARLYSGDPSAGIPTPQQSEYVNVLRGAMGGKHNTGNVGMDAFLRRLMGIH